MNIGIIGGGLSGISLQYYLKHPSIILEKNNNIGGLCRTFEKQGFYYDIGGHALFSKDKQIMNTINTVLSDNFHFCKRINKILFKNKYVKYPFENELSTLNKEDTFDCLFNFIENEFKSYSNFEEWIYYTFGKGIADRYLIPYNKKIWKTSLNKMNTEWVDRIPKPPLEDIIKSAIGINTEGYVHQLNFGYPKYGGIQSLVTAFCKNNLDIKTNYCVTNIKKNNNKWIISNGLEKNEFDKLVITAPIIDLLKYIDNVPSDIIDAANRLKYNTIRVVMIGINNDSLMDKSCIFIPDENILTHRICFMGYFSKNNVPEGKSSLIAEITSPINSDIYNMSNDNIIENVVNGLSQINIINKNDIIVTDCMLEQYGYVIPNNNYREDLNKIKSYTDFIGIYLLGRFGEHDYINMDQVLMRSCRLATHLNTY